MTTLAQQLDAYQNGSSFPTYAELREIAERDKWREAAQAAKEIDERNAALDEAAQYVWLGLQLWCKARRVHPGDYKELFALVDDVKALKAEVTPQVTRQIEAIGQKETA